MTSSICPRTSGGSSRTSRTVQSFSARSGAAHERRNEARARVVGHACGAPDGTSIIVPVATTRTGGGSGGHDWSSTTMRSERHFDVDLLLRILAEEGCFQPPVDHVNCRPRRTEFRDTSLRARAKEVRTHPEFSVARRPRERARRAAVPVEATAKAGRHVAVSVEAPRGDGARVGRFGAPRCNLWCNLLGRVR